MYGKSHAQDQPEPAKALVRKFVSDILDADGIKVPTLASKAGIAASTLYRILDADDPFTASLRTIEKLEAATGYRFGTGGASGFAEDEAEPYSAAHGDPLAAVIAGLVAGNPARVAWRLNTRAVELAGYLPGDIVILDLNEPPRSGDLVCAQVYQFERMRAETVWRILEGPYLVAASTDPAMRAPRTVDANTAIKGRVVAMFRQH